MAVIEGTQSFRRSRPLMGHRVSVSRFGFSVIAALLELAVIVSLSVLTGLAYHMWRYGSAGEVLSYFGLGAGIALLYALPFFFGEGHRTTDLIEGRKSIGRMGLVWTYAFACLGLIGFVTKTTDYFSRGWLMLFFVLGFAALSANEQFVRRLLDYLVTSGRLARRRLMLVGHKDQVERLSQDITEDHPDVHLSGVVVVPDVGDLTGEGGTRRLARAMEGAVSKARAISAEDIVILADWSQTTVIQEVVEAFRALPVSIHLGAPNVVGPFTDSRISNFPGLTAVSLTAPPLSPMQNALKRTFDIVISFSALLLMAPLFLTIAGLIKATSPGPVFFLQRRRGYNQFEFKIWKFRTMTTMDDGETIVQARPHDQRVTTVGRYLRRLSFDELPQLINVLIGDMSLVGPRPHAIAHDEIFEKRISTYSRRLNVRPGITGWAQVQGFRGLTDTDEAMRRRVEADLYYIDNWSIALDLYILILTLLSPRTFINAH